MVKSILFYHILSFLQAAAEDLEPQPLGAASGGERAQGAALWTRKKALKSLENHGFSMVFH